MGFSVIYKPLTIINFLHSYFLNVGETSFNGMTDDEKKKRLESYNFDSFINILPTPKTEFLLKGNKLRFTTTNVGFQISASVTEYEEKTSGDPAFCPLIQTEEGLTLTFQVIIKDSFFNNYTAEMGEQPDQLFYFSNISPDSEPGSFPDIWATGKMHADYRMSEEGSAELFKELVRNENFNGITFQKVTTIPEEEINTPDSQALIKQSLNEATRKGLLGFVQIRLLSGGSSDLLTQKTVVLPDSSEETLWCLPTDVSTGQIFFTNRETFWRYFIKNSGEEKTTTSAKPLTRNGYVAIEETDFDSGGSSPGNSGKKGKGKNKNKSNKNKPDKLSEDLFYPNPNVSRIRRIDDNWYSEIFI